MKTYIVTSHQHAHKNWTPPKTHDYGAMEQVEFDSLHEAKTYFAQRIRDGFGYVRLWKTTVDTGIAIYNEANDHLT
jgi:hypothetical protein